MRRRRLIVLIGVLVLAGCAGDDGDPSEADGGASNDTPDATTAEVETPAAPFEWEVTSVDFGYELATSEVPAGPVQVTQVNEGDEEHQVTLIRLDDGQSADDLATLIAEEGDAALAPAAFAGGPNGVPGGETNTALVELAAGEYVAYCFIPQHAQQGMVEPFTVTGESAGPAEVESASTIRLDDFAFDVPDDWDGQGAVEVVNDGSQPHELTIVSDGQTGAGGLTAIAPGATGFVDLALRPGRYQFVCFVADPATGQIHLQLGMQSEVTIT